MFIGHFGTAFAAKKVAPRPSLGTLIFAGQFIDLLWPILLLLGIERVILEPGNTVVTPLDYIYYPFSHSLAGVMIWGILFGVIYYLLKKNMRSSVVLGLLVLSHWVLDLFTHRPDLPLLPRVDLKVGLGLWNSLPATLVVESLIFFGGAYLFTSATRAVNKKGSYGWWGLVGLLFLIYLMNIFGPPPPSVEPIPVIGLLQWIFVAWGYWIDRNRQAV